LDLATFESTVGSPNDFVTVKAITGCTSDSVPGVPGVGPVTAWKWVRGEFISAARTAAIKASTEIIDRNIKLIKLPMQGTPSFALKIPQYNLEAIATIKELHEAVNLKEWRAFLGGRLSMEQMQRERMRARHG
jgi:5'-3' exonuclease